MNICREDIIKDINSEIELLKDKNKIVIWGLGEYAERILVTTDLVKYGNPIYVDSAREGKFFGQFIYRPESINWELIDAVVILSFFHYEKIESLLRNRYSYNKIILKPGIGKEKKEFYKVCKRKELELDEKEQLILDMNKKIKGIGYGKKCFILGNGPSLKQNNIEEIKEKSVVFSVNEFFRVGSKARISDYVVADPLYFNPQEELSDDFFKNFKEYKTKNQKVRYWFPIDYYDYIRMKLGDIEDCYFFSPYGGLGNIKANEIDLSCRVPSRFSVIHYCIQMAIYMEVDSIYLVGCEETGIFGVLNNYIDIGFDEHAYNVSEKQQTLFNNYVNKNIPITLMLGGFLEIFKGYKTMSSLCAEKEIPIYTCAKKTLLQDIKYISFEEAIK